MKSLWFVALLMCACAAAGPPVGPTGGGSGGSGGSATGGGSGTGGGGTIVPEGLPLKSACTTLNAKRCDYLVRCGLLEDSDQARRDCTSWLLTTWCGPTRWPSHVEAGKLLYDGKVAQSCADAFTTRTCEDYESVPTACNRITTANVSPLAACYDGYAECTEGLVCRGAACPRTCLSPGAPGDVCQFDSDCRPLLYCKRTMPLTGVGTCTNLGMANALCSKDEPCGVGLVCSGGKCIVPPTTGAPCATGQLCDDTSWCQYTPDGGVCATRQGVGTQCTDDVQCMAGHLCQMGSCEPRVLGIVMSDCSDRQVCPQGTTCVGATVMALGRCNPPLAGGESCIASDDCQKHLACAPVDGGLALACARRQANQQSCTLDRDCQVLSKCKGGTCTRLPVTNQSCADEGACLYGPCVGTPDGGALCAEKHGPGLRCTADSDCVSNRCVNSTCLPPCAP